MYSRNSKPTKRIRRLQMALAVALALLVTPADCAVRCIGTFGIDTELWNADLSNNRLYVRYASQDVQFYTLVSYDLPSLKRHKSNFKVKFVAANPYECIFDKGGGRGRESTIRGILPSNERLKRVGGDSQYYWSENYICERYFNGNVQAMQRTFEFISDFAVTQNAVSILGTNLLTIQTNRGVTHRFALDESKSWSMAHDESGRVTLFDGEKYFYTIRSVSQSRFDRVLVHGLGDFRLVGIARDKLVLTSLSDVLVLDKDLKSTKIYEADSSVVKIQVQNPYVLVLERSRLLKLFRI